MKYKRIIALLFSLPLFGSQNFILIGPPGSGKGTFSSYMIERAGYVHICPGDIVRNHIKKETKLGKEIKPIVERGEYIDDGIIYTIIEDLVIGCIKNMKPFIIDGFPRHREGLEFLIELLRSQDLIDRVSFIYFVIDDALCTKRIMDRLVCFDCHESFNRATKCPQQDFICDKCGNNLEERFGDTRAVTEKRLWYYRTTIEPLIDAIKKSFLVVEFDARLCLNDCNKFYEQLLK